MFSKKHEWLAAAGLPVGSRRPLWSLVDPSKDNTAGVDYRNDGDQPLLFIMIVGWRWPKWLVSQPFLGSDGNGWLHSRIGPFSLGIGNCRC
jgi:hypothetical protein